MELCQRFPPPKKNLIFVVKVKMALYNGGIARSNKPEHASNTPGIQRWEDIEIIYAGQIMKNDETLASYHVPPVRCVDQYLDRIFIRIEGNANPHFQNISCLLLNDNITTLLPITAGL